MQMISHQAYRIQAMRHLLLGLSEHSQQNITSQSFGNQKLTAIAAECEVKGVYCWKLALSRSHSINDQVR